MQVVITLAGRGRRFSEKGFHQPKPIVPVAGRPALYYLMDALPAHWSLNFVLAEHDRASALETVIKEKSPSSRVIYTPFSERGPIDTVLAAMPLLDSQKPVLVSYCDLAPVWDAFDFAEKCLAYDFASVNYQGFHPTYLGPNSYCHVQADLQTQTVIRFQEKILFTDHLQKEITSAGIYYFKNKDLLQMALAEQLRQNLKYKNEFYVSLALQAAMNQNNCLKVLDYRVAQIVQFGTPADTERFEFWYKYFTAGEKQKEFLYIEASQNPLQLPADFFEKEKSYWAEVFRYFKFI